MWFLTGSARVIFTRVADVLGNHLYHLVINTHTLTHTSRSFDSLQMEFATFELAATTSGTNNNILKDKIRS